MSEELSSLDAEAIALFYAGTSQRPQWWEFTDLQKNHWRKIAQKAREIHRAEAFAPMIRAYAVSEYQKITEAVESHTTRPFNIDGAARTLHANTHDAWQNSRDWEDLTEQEQEGWRDRAKAVVKAGREA